MISLHDAPIVELSELDSNNLIKLKNDNSIVLVGGCFDLLHLGHVAFLKNAKNKGDLLIVAIESDRFIEESKKRTPFHNQDQRAKVLSSMRYVDLVVKLPYFENAKRDEAYAGLVDVIKPNTIAVTENDKAYEKKKNHADRVGAKIEVVTKNLESLSSSAILKYGNLLSD
ncbi:MAG: adenylyltransferase/cytidyltransferase family protein [Patescibacteria group bacterium]